MPADVDLFNMHQPAVVQAMNKEQLQAEYERTIRMADAVAAYRSLVLKVLLDLTTAAAKGPGK